MLQTYTVIWTTVSVFEKRVKIVDFFKINYPHVPIKRFCESYKINHVLVKLHRIVFTFKSPYVCKLRVNKNTTFQLNLSLAKMQEATFKLVITQRQYVDRFY